jgi:hypothetical protein
MSHVCNVRALKQVALRFPEPTRSLILSEPDDMSSEELLIKLGTWDKLLKMQVHRK